MDSNLTVSYEQLMKWKKQARQVYVYVRFTEYDGEYVRIPKVELDNIIGTTQDFKTAEYIAIYIDEDDTLHIG